MLIYLVLVVLGFGMTYQDLANSCSLKYYEPVILFIREGKFRNIHFIIKPEDLNKGTYRDVFQMVTKNLTIPARFISYDVIQTNEAQYIEERYKSLYLMSIDDKNQVDLIDKLPSTVLQKFWIILLCYPEGKTNTFKLPIDNRITFLVESSNGNFEYREFYQSGIGLPVYKHQTGYFSKRNGTIHWKMDSTVIWPRRTNLTGVHFRCGCLPTLPSFIVTLGDDGIERLSGQDAEIFLEVQRQLNFTFTCTRPLDGTYGSTLPDGSWTGLLKQILDDETDIVVTPLDFSYERAEVVDFLHGFISYGFHLFMKKPPRHGSAWSNYTREFSAEAWLMFGIFSVFYATIFTTTTLLWSHKNKIQSNVVFMLLTTLLNQNSSFRPHFFSISLLYIVWLIFCYLVYAHYTSFLISSLTVVKLQLPFSDMNGLLKQKHNYKISINSHSSVELAFKTATDSIIQRVWKEMVSPNKEYQRTEIRDMIDLVGSSNEFVGVTDQRTFFFLRRCDLIALPSLFMRTHTSFAVKKNFTYYGIINYQLKKTLESGIVGRLENYFTQEYKVNYCEEPPWSPIDATQSLTAFGTWSVLIAASIIVLLLEFCHKRYTRLSQI